MIKLKSLVAVVFLNLLSIHAFAGQIEVSVRDQSGNPAAEAFVLIGPSENSPFQGNWVKTGNDGVAAFIADDIQNQPITLSKKGYPHITYYNQSGSRFDLRLPDALPTQTVEVSGEFTGWQNPGEGNNASVGLFFPLLTLNKLFTFQISDFVSSALDKITVMGKDIYLPANISLPQQTLYYGFFPIDLDKPQFRLPVPSPGLYHFTGVTGRFPFQKVVDKLRNKQTFYDVLNDMSLEHFSTLTNQRISQPLKNVKMDINQGSFGSCVQVSSAQSPENRRVISVAMVRQPGLTGVYQPTDIKTIDSPSQNVGCIDGDNQPVTILSLATRFQQNLDVLVVDKGVSAIIAKNIPRSGNQDPVKFDSYFAVPQVSASQQGQKLSVTRADRSGISPQAEALFAVFSEVTETTIGKYKQEEVKPKWVVFANASSTDFTLPQLPPSMAETVTTDPVVKQRWEATWLGYDHRFEFGDSAASSPLGYGLFEIMTHAARNSIDF